MTSRTKVSSIQVAADKLLALVEREKNLAAQSVVHTSELERTSAICIKENGHVETDQDTLHVNLQQELKRMEEYLDELARILQVSGVCIRDSVLSFGEPWTSLVHPAYLGGHNTIPASHLFDLLRAPLTSASPGDVRHMHHGDPAQKHHMYAPPPSVPWLLPSGMTQGVAQHTMHSYGPQPINQFPPQNSTISHPVHRQDARQPTFEDHSSPTSHIQAINADGHATESFPSSTAWPPRKNGSSLDNALYDVTPDSAISQSEQLLQEKRAITSTSRDNEQDETVAAKESETTMSAGQSTVEHITASQEPSCNPKRSASPLQGTTNEQKRVKV